MKMELTYEKEVVLEIAKQIRGTASCMNEIFRLTKELAESLQRDDRVSIQMLLEMRKEEMDKADSFQKSIKILVESTPVEMRTKLAIILDGRDCAELDIPEASIVTAATQEIRNTAKQTQTIDRVMSMKLAGEDSFYAQQSKQ